MTDATQAIVWDAVYRPFGEVHAITGAAANNLRFPGQYFLIESGLHYNWHRHYDPTLGRYIQPDPLRFIDGPSVYAYANSTPPMKVDPDGRQGSVIIPRPGPPIPIPPDAWDRWRQQAEEGIGGLIKFCRRILSSSGSGGENNDPCERQTRTDEATCRSLARPDVRARCYESANARYGACRSNKPLPPLVTW